MTNQSNHQLPIHRPFINVQHLRRYYKRDFIRPENESVLTLSDASYLIFYLSPLYLLNRSRFGFGSMTLAQKKELISKWHQVSFSLINSILSAIFGAESPIGHWLNIPWGISIHEVFKKT